MSWEPELPLSASAITIHESAFGNVPERGAQNKSRVDSHNRNEGRFSKLRNGKGIPETQERDPESQQNSCSVEELRKKFEPPALTHGPEKPPQKESRVDSPKRVQANFSKQSKGNEDPVILERALNHVPEKSSQKESSVDSHRRVQANFSKPSTGNADPVILERALNHVPEKSSQKESSVDTHRRVQTNFSKQSKGSEDPVILERGRTVEMSTSEVVESMREEMEKILSKKLAVLQRELVMTQHAIPPMNELTNTWTTLQSISENVQALQKDLENMHVSTKEGLQMLRADLEERVPKAWNTPKRSESEENLLDVENHGGFFKMQRYKVDVTLNADTAHPRLEVSEDGKSVNDTGVIRQVPSKEERFDSHIFVLAKEGYTSGRKYWEVDVGKRRNWILGVASESVARKGTVNLSPKNGFWVIGLTDGEEYWAHTDPWTRLTASGRPQKIGVFLDISANKLSFYDAKKKSALYTFTSIGDSRLERKFIPFFSTGSGVSALDTEPLKIVQGFDDDD
ncbi:E3 ubiquitin-protein ligase TRIM39-like isoform X2 [Tympanuchus pallidicinctus]|uniref:E3 ubiquitin-protein ligase TRIM39-like isoform X2 n=1 Tax=Tympanuchus pallidicinctus TaxID=109042 RepID=UPI00228752AD|nr:E3 ubiquitin-protein ligase TRIM39-like isoform X2 [Tympanuchus pallidicinctus]